jgi:hypothetical protein
MEVLASKDKAEAKEASSWAVNKVYYKNQAKGEPSLLSCTARFDIVYSLWKESYFIRGSAARS